MSDLSDSLSSARKRRYYVKNRQAIGINLRLRAARKRAERLGLPFELNGDDLATPETCPICGTKLAMQEGQGGGNSSPSMDRIVPTLGYTKANTVILCHSCNRKKQNSTAEELAALAEWIFRIREERGLC